MKKTNRGFRIYSEFKDTYGADVRVQMSSNVLKRCWIFVKGGMQKEYADKNDGSLHLSEAQAKRLITALQKFIQDP
jgi:hypothetical protein